jgi:hypothetical protein
MMFNGCRVVVSEAALAETTERNFPLSRHRSRRVHKKLVKRFGGEFRKEPAIFQTPDSFIMHPTRWVEVEREMRRRNAVQPRSGHEHNGAWQPRYAGL